jgi:glycosyltransferase involved in cell wall biosynthesis
MNKLKVVQLLPELNIGGVERGTKDFSEALVQRGHKSIVISNGGLFEQDIINAGGIHLKLPIHKKNPISFLQATELVRIYKEYEPDIVHVRSRMPAWINYYAFKKLDKKPILISTFHGLYSTPIYSQVMAKVDHTIAISKTVRDYIKNTYSVEDKNITIIPRGCDPLLFNKTKPDINWLNSWYEEFPQTKNKIILTLPTRISKWKGVDSFIDLISDINNDSFHALVVGPTSKKKKKYLNDLKAKIKDKGLSSLITFTGSRSDISNIYKISDIVYNLSVKPEPFGRTTIEAIASGSKVIGWNHGGTKEILEELYPDGLVELNDIAKLKQQTLIISKENYAKPKENTFLSSKLIDSTIQLYRDLLKASL